MIERAPRVSMGLPVFNGEKYLADALNCLIGQDYEDFELVISDNASTDKTPEICTEFARKDRRIHYFRNDRNIGLAPNHNRVFKLSRGEFFKWVAHDDEYSTSMLRRYVEVFETAPPSVSVVYSAFEAIDESGAILRIDSDPVAKRHPHPYRRLARLLSHRSMYNFTYGLIRSESLRRTSLLGPFPMADLVLFCELSMVGEFLEIPEPLLRLRIHSGRSFQAHRTPDALRELYDPVEAAKPTLLSLEGRVLLELLRSTWRVPQGSLNRLSCFCTAITVPCLRQLIRWSSPFRHRIGLYRHKRDPANHTSMSDARRNSQNSIACSKSLNE